MKQLLAFLCHFSHTGHEFRDNRLRAMRDITTMNTRLSRVAAAVLTLLIPPTLLAGSVRPEGGTDPAAIDLRSVPGIVRYDDGFAIPLAAARPAWYTSELEAQVLASPGVPVTAPLDAPLPGTIGIRPGSWMISPNWCTMNFVFSKDGEIAIGTAGHCVVDVGQRVVLLTVAPATNQSVLVNIGSVILRRNNGGDDDFALVSIEQALLSWVSPTIAVVGGPCGAYTARETETVWWYGHGTGAGTGGTPRSGVAHSSHWFESYFFWIGPTSFGDSGSAVRVDSGLRAAGVFTRFALPWFDTPVPPTTSAGMRIGAILRIAQGWCLVSSPLCEDGGVVVCDTVSALPSPAPTASPSPPRGRLQNISTRVRAETDDNIPIAGFIITGRDGKRVLIRGLGPSLARAAVADPLQDPTLELYSSDGTLVVANDNWQDSQHADIAATGLAPSDDRESAIAVSLAPASYTAVLRGKNNTTGVSLVEVYDLNQSASSELVNISTRGLVQTDDDIVIGGFIPDGGPTRVVVRGLGTSLDKVGVANPLQDPTLELRNQDGELILANDNWKDSQRAEIEAAGLAPERDAESAVVATLQSAPATVILRGKAGTTGVGLVEVYKVQ